jgi:S-DNA-T family DNA segregation ATPase FtsK/SpoIIIE
VIWRRELRPEGRPPSIRFRPPSVHIPLALLAAGWLVVLAARALRWLAVHPRCTIVGAVAALLVVTDRLVPAISIVCLGAAGLMLWWLIDSEHFARWVARPVQLQLREWFTYRRHWQPAMLSCGLSLRESWGGDLPTLRTVRDDGERDLLRVRMLPGQTLERWTEAAPALAQTFGVRAVRVRRVPNRPQELVLAVTRRTGSNRHVTELPAPQEPRTLPAPRGAFPRAPRGGVS